MRTLPFLFFFLISSSLVLQAQQKQKDPALSMEEQLTVGEKIDLLCADAPAVERLGITRYDWWSECLNGVARNGKATVFPKPIGLGSTWDPDLIQKIATAISDEARAKYHAALRKQGYTKRYEGLTFFSPTLNLARDPRWGRTSECFSEDPYLTGELGAVFIEGLQGDDPTYLKLVATPKHFVANNEENRRNDGSADVDEVSLREYYFPAFEKSIKRGKATSVMSAYNALNGVPCSASSFLLTDVLRKEWGFDGVVMSDGSAVAKIYTHHHYASSPAAAAAMALLAGCDMSLRDEYREGLREALRQGLVSEADIDRSLHRVLTLRARLGMFEKEGVVRYSRIPESVIECEAHQKLALEAARRSIILLKNEGQILPLKKEQKIILVGDAFNSNYYGDYSGTPEHQTLLLEELSKRTGNANISWIPEVEDFVLIPSSCFQRDEKEAYDGKIGLTGDYFTSSDLSGKPLLTRNDHTIQIALFKEYDLINNPFPPKSIRWTTNLVSDKTGEHTLQFEGGINITLFIAGKEIPVDSVTKRASIFLTKGKPEPLQIEVRQINPYKPISLTWKQPSEKAQTPLSIAKSADKIILFIRDDGAAEGRDRESLSLSSKQLSLIEKITDINPNVVLILGSSTAMNLKEVAPKVKAILNSWIAGQGESQALAEILLGEVNPSGKTPVTFVANESELPPLNSYDVKEGRSYQYFKGKVLYPFGFGLSYTSFAYGTPKAGKNRMNATDSVTLSIQVTNTGSVDGEEVVQCYASYAEWQMDGLQKKLVDFKRVYIPKGKSKIVSFTIPVSRLARWDKQTKSWKTQPGAYQFSVAENSSVNRLVSVDID